MLKKIVLGFLLVSSVTACIPNPRFDWGNAKYNGYVTDVTGLPIKKALVIVKDKNFLSDVTQITETDTNGFYEIKPKKIFFIVGALLAPPPACIDEQYVIHPDYEAYFKKRKLTSGGRICTDIEVQRNVILRKKEKVRNPEDYELPTWSNLKIGMSLYSYDELDKATVLDINQEKDKVILKFDADIVKYRGKVYIPKGFPQWYISPESKWYIKRIEK